MEKKTRSAARPRAATAPATRKTTTTAKAAAPRKRATKGTAGTAATAATPFQPSHDQIATFAYSLFEQSGHQHGRAIDHWLEAESRLSQGLKVG